MLKIIISLRALFFASFLLFIGNSYLLSSNAIVLKTLGYSEFQIGAVNSCVYLGAMFSTFFSQIIIQRLGHIRSFGFFVSLFGVLALSHIFTDNIFFWVFFRFFIGFSYYTLLIIIESWINTKAKNTIRSRILALYEIIFYFGFALGVLLLYFVSNSKDIFIIVTLIILFCSIPLNLIKIKQPKLLEKGKISLPSIFKVSKLAFVAAFIGGFLMNGFFTMSQTYFLALKFNVKDISLFIAASMLGGFLSQIVVGRLSDIYGRKLAILCCCVIGILASFGLLLFASSYIFALIFCFFLGVGVFCLYSLALARASDRAKQSSQILEIGRTLMFAYVSSSVISPLFLGFLIEFYGVNAYVLSYLILLGFLFIFTLTQPKIDYEDRINYNEKPSQFVYLGQDEKY